MFYIISVKRVAFSLCATLRFEYLISKFTKNFCPLKCFQSVKVRQSEYHEKCDPFSFSNSVDIDDG